MKSKIPFVFLMLAAVLVFSPRAVPADEVTSPEIVFPGDSTDLSEFVWTKRPLVVFADSPNDPRFIQQMEFISKGATDLFERDVIVLTDTDRSADSALRTKLRPRGFMLVLLGKDGVIYLRKPLPWDTREISRVIDKLPLRKQEIRDRRGDS